jgi:phosphatidylinositol glycan class N
MHRLFILIFSFAPVFVILSISYETLFYFAFSLTLLLWLILEAKLFEFHRQKTEKPPTAGVLKTEHLRISACFLFFIHVGFFGTG